MSDYSQLIDELLATVALIEVTPDVFEVRAMTMLAVVFLVDKCSPKPSWRRRIHWIKTSLSFTARLFFARW